MKKARKNCEKGYNCGNTCIERLDDCFYNLTSPTSVAIAERMMELRAATSKGYLEVTKKDERTMTKVLSFDDNQEVKIKISESTWIPGHQMIDFFMNRSYDANTANVLPSMKLKMAKATKKEINNMLAEYPEGTKFVAIPNASDGKQDSREKAYINAGFGPKDPDSEFMSAVLENGKLVPGSPIRF